MMNKHRPLSIALPMMLTLLLQSACGAGGSQAAVAGNVSVDLNARYEHGSASRDGIGKFYLDREISQVMGHLGASWLERPAREQEERTDLLIENLPLHEDSIVADIGAGTGYFSFPIARELPAGKVIAVDIQQEMLDIIEARQVRGAPSNVETLLGAEGDTRLPEAAVDLILIVDAYHEFSEPYDMGLSMARALKPGGELILIEYRAEDRSVPIKPLHKMSEQQAIREMAEVGLEWVRTEDFLPQQHFLVFRRPEQRRMREPAQERKGHE